ncbi:MAG TPA: PDZ domain-containing protein [Mycobacteriales bacterium]|nr:PDZ domain-containing protein [Mycobacteriales bacterium]
MSRRTLTPVVAALVTLVVIVGGAVLPVPYVALAPGPVTDTLGASGGKPLISIEGHPTYPARGRLDLTTVAVSGGPEDRLDLGRAVLGWVDPTVAVVPRNLVYPPGKTVKEVEADNAEQMQQSQEAASAAAVRQLGLPVSTTVAVAGVAPRVPATGRLQPGDVIRSVDGTAVSSVRALQAAMARVCPGATVTLAVVRGGRQLVVPVPTDAMPDNPHRARLGIIPRNRYHLPFRVSIRLKDVGGPSAGSMFALGIVEKLTPADVAAGRHIAGTGEIDADGKVGAIGGVQQKVVAASNAGATIFLTPAGNCAPARRVRPRGLRLVRVTTLAEALQALDALRTGRGRVPAC